MRGFDVKIAVIGGGKIGTALVAGLVRGGTPPGDVIVADSSREQVDRLSASRSTR